MSESYENQYDEESPMVRQFSKGQRRVLGVLIEKGLTTPDQYPLTLKAATTGANQKSNRDPVTNFTEGAIWDLCDELREMGLVSVVHPESGRTERFRHYVRRKYPFNEKQLAIMAELFLRGRQQLGELRSRASRMVTISSLDELREELRALKELGFIQASGSLERRGIEVDHNMYLDTEEQKLETISDHSAEPDHRASESSKSPNDALSSEVDKLRTELNFLSQTVDELKDDLEQLRRSLGA